MNNQNVKAIDIVIMLPHEVENMVIQLNKELLVSNPMGRVRLSQESSVPHVTIWMGAVATTDLEDIQSVLIDLSKRHRRMSLLIDSVRTKEMPDGQYDSALNVAMNADLMHFHTDVTDSLSKYVVEERFVELNSLYDQGIGAKEMTLSWINNFPKKSIKDDYWPHITLGLGEVEMEGVQLPIQFEATEFALCHLGDFCTVQEVLWQTVLQ